MKRYILVPVCIVSLMFFPQDSFALATRGDTENSINVHISTEQNSSITVPNAPHMPSSDTHTYKNPPLDEHLESREEDVDDPATHVKMGDNSESNEDSKKASDSGKIENQILKEINTRRSMFEENRTPSQIEKEKGITSTDIIYTIIATIPSPVSQIDRMVSLIQSVVNLF